MRLLYFTCWKGTFPKHRQVLMSRSGNSHNDKKYCYGVHHTENKLIIVIMNIYKEVSFYFFVVVISDAAN